MQNRHKVLLAQEHAAKILPSKMDTQAARVLIIATGFQESNFSYRRQKNRGPAVSFFQFERIAIKEVITNVKTKRHALRCLDVFGVEADVERIWKSLQQERFDALAFCFARLNYWINPLPLPEPGYEIEAWNYYLNTWRPGKPHPNSWPRFYWRAYGAIIG